MLRPTLCPTLCSLFTGSHGHLFSSLTPPSTPPPNPTQTPYSISTEKISQIAQSPFQASSLSIVPKTARQKFEEMPVRDTRSWSALVSESARLGPFSDALEFYSQMKLEGLSVNEFVLGGLLKASACTADV
ncbi:hypothetical protein AMTR_s01590p00000130, partial [Amborella trichopoda]